MRAVPRLRGFLLVLGLAGVTGNTVASGCPEPVRTAVDRSDRGPCELPAAARDDLALLDTPAGGEVRRLGDGESLRALASDLSAEMTPDSVGLWEQFVSWLRQVFSADADETQWPAWLEDWLGDISVSASMVEVLYYVVLVLLAAFVGWFLIREVRAARRDRLDPPASEGAGPVRGAGWRRVLSADAIAALEPGERPAAWVAWTVAALARRERLERAMAWTNREIARHLERRRPELAPLFRRLAGRAEAVTYGGRVPDREMLEHTEADARELAGRLSEVSP